MNNNPLKTYKERIKKACQCQILTGSFEGNKNPCSCRGAADCCFSGEEINELSKHPEVILTRKENRRQFLLNDYGM